MTFSGQVLVLALCFALLWELSQGESRLTASPRLWFVDLASRVTSWLPRGKPVGEVLGSVFVVGVAAILPAFLAWWLIERALYERPYLPFILTVVLLQGSITLLEHGRRARDVQHALRLASPFEAHELVAPWARRRDLPFERDHLVCATFETLARRITGGFIAPLFWFAIAGVPGAIFQRGVEELYEALRPTARAPQPAEEVELDEEIEVPQLPERRHLARTIGFLHQTLLFAPARFAALLMLVSAKLLGEDAPRGLAVTARAGGLGSDALPMASLAGALGAPATRLDGRELAPLSSTEAWLREPREPLAAARIQQSWRVVCLAAAVWAVLVALTIWSAGGTLIARVRA